MWQYTECIFCELNKRLHASCSIIRLPREPKTTNRTYLSFSPKKHKFTHSNLPCKFWQQHNPLHGRSVDLVSATHARGVAVSLAECRKHSTVICLPATVNSRSMGATHSNPASYMRILYSTRQCRSVEGESCKGRSTSPSRFWFSPVVHIRDCITGLTVRLMLVTCHITFDPTIDLFFIFQKCRE